MSRQFTWEIIGLQTPRGRLTAAGILHALLLIVPFAWLEAAHLSLYERLSIPSPSIGLTRAYWQLLHGNLAAAWERNELIFIVVPILVCVLLIDAWKLFGRKEQSTVSF